MTKVKVAVVILNYNGKSFLETYLPSVIEYSGNCEIYVADNGSSDDSLSFLKQRFPQIHVIDNKGNFGYAKGYNLALKEIEAEYYVLLNSDVEVTINWVQSIIELMDTNKQIAACQPKILDLNNKHRFEYAGASGGFIDKYGYPFCRGRIFNTLETDEAQFDSPREVFWATGACLFIRAEAFWKVNGFDDDYFAHMEEIDLCWRLKNLGYSVFVEPASKVYHLGGGTLHKISAKKTFLNFRNNLSTLAKNHSPRYLLLKIVFRLILDGVAAFKFLFDGQAKHFLAVIKAHFNFYYWLPSILIKRKKQKQIIGFRYCKTYIYQKNIVFEYFLKGKSKFENLKGSFFAE